MDTVEPGISPLGRIYFLDFFMGGLSEGGTLKVFLVVGRIPVEVFLLTNCSFDATHASIRIFFKVQANLR